MENLENILQTSSECIQEIQNSSVENVEKLGSIPPAGGNVEITECIKKAHEIIDEVIEKSEKNIENICPLLEDDNIPNIKWLSIQEFNVENGKMKIDEFIKTWERRPNWLYCIDFLCEEPMEYSVRCRYRVQWSIPTRRKPIPRATAAVYFTIEISNVKPKDTLVQVYFIFESSKLVHRPGASRFREKWLKDIIDAKVLLMESITF